LKLSSYDDGVADEPVTPRQSPPGWPVGCLTPISMLVTGPILDRFSPPEPLTASSMGLRGQRPSSVVTGMRLTESDRQVFLWDMSSGLLSSLIRCSPCSRPGGLCLGWSPPTVSLQPPASSCLSSPPPLAGIVRPSRDLVSTNPRSRLGGITLHMAYSTRHQPRSKTT